MLGYKSSLAVRSLCHEREKYHESTYTVISLERKETCFLLLTKHSPVWSWDMGSSGIEPPLPAS